VRDSLKLDDRKKEKEKENEKENEKGFCEFCGAEFTKTRSWRKYCSEHCAELAVKRRTSARLGIPPARRNVSPLSNPLYFN
jgi:predicted amidophosphoribosyltransferase